MTSGTERVALSLAANSFQRLASNYIRESQAWLACSYASISSFCILNIASVCSWLISKGSGGDFAVPELDDLFMATPTSLSRPMRITRALAAISNVNGVMW
jgi:hypothetical protein